MLEVIRAFAIAALDINILKQNYYSPAAGWARTKNTGYSCDRYLIGDCRIVYDWTLGLRVRLLTRLISTIA